jgi:hypothetical protein
MHISGEIRVLKGTVVNVGPGMISIPGKFNERPFRVNPVTTSDELEYILRMSDQAAWIMVAVVIEPLWSDDGCKHLVELEVSWKETR